MKKLTKIILVMALLSGTAFSSLADRGIGRKSRNKVDLNVSTISSFRNDIFFNMRNGLKYTGSLLSKQQSEFNTPGFNNLVTFQKGNTVYIIPYKQVVAIPEISSGYTGMKIIIRTH